MEYVTFTLDREGTLHESQAGLRVNRSSMNNVFNCTRQVFNGV